MTVEQCVLFLESQAEVRNERFKEDAILLNGLSIQVVSGVAGLFNNKAKMMPLKKLYPEIFSEAKNKNNTEQMSQTQIWLKFLYS